MSSRHETPSAWHGFRECSSMRRMKVEVFFLPPGHSWRVLNWCHSIVSFQDMIISGLQPETSYSLTVTAYTTKGDGARSKPKLVSTTGAGNLVCACMCLECVPGNNNTNSPNGIGGFYQREKGKKLTVVNFCVLWYIIQTKKNSSTYLAWITQSFTK